MASYNKVVLIGNLTRDPELRHTPSGTAVVDIGLAINENYKTKEGETVEQTVFVDIICWGRQAETSAEFLSKGSSILVDGKIQYDQWETESGDKRNKIRVRAERIQFLTSKKEVSTNRPSTVMDEDLPSSSGSSALIDDDDIPF